MNIQIHREGGTIMIQLNHGTQIYAAVVLDRDGGTHLAVGDACSPQEFVFGCQSQGFDVRHSVNVIEVLEESLRRLDISPKPDRIEP